MRSQRRENPSGLALQAVGSPDIDLDILGNNRWDMSAPIADNFAVGLRIFLIGDAAHSLPPNRGASCEHGIADAFNLSWKLAQVVNGISDQGLLSTYESERLPIAWLRHDQIFARSDFKTLQKDGANGKMGNGGGAIREKTQLADDAVEFGELYRSDGFLYGLEDPSALPDAKLPDEWAGQPGTRAPHVRILNVQGSEVSTIELFGRKWILLSGNWLWKAALAQLAPAIRAQIEFVQLRANSDEELSRILDAYGISSNGCSLIRPDGYIAWRSVLAENRACRKPWRGAEDCNVSVMSTNYPRKEFMSPPRFLRFN